MMAVGLVFDSRELHVYVSNLQLVHRTFFRDCVIQEEVLLVQGAIFFSSPWMCYILHLVIFVVLSVNLFW